MVKEQYLPNHTRDEGMSSQNQMKIIVAVDFGMNILRSCKSVNDID